MIMKIVTNPLELGIEPGKTVGQLTSAEECQAAIFLIEMDMERIQAQIARSEAEPGSSDPGWRSRAQSAIRWKKRTRSAVHEHARQFVPPKPPFQQRYSALCDIVRQELGREEFDRLLDLARSTHPKAFVEGALDV